MYSPHAAMARGQLVLCIRFHIALSARGLAARTDLEIIMPARGCAARASPQAGNILARHVYVYCHGVLCLAIYIYICKAN